MSHEWCAVIDRGSSFESIAPCMRLRLAYPQCKQTSHNSGLTSIMTFKPLAKHELLHQYPKDLKLETAHIVSTPSLSSYNSFCED